MLTIDKTTARRLLDVVRRVQAKRRRTADAAVHLHGADRSLSVLLIAGDFLVQFLEAGAFGEGRACLALDDFLSVLQEGKDGLELESESEGEVAARWTDDGIPRSRHVEPKCGIACPPFPEPPAWKAATRELAAALNEARKCCGANTVRLAIDKLCLRGRQGDIAGTDGCQLLVWSGFDFPWEEQVLIEPPLLLEAREFLEAARWEIAKSDRHVLLRTGAWSIACPIAQAERFPNFDAAIPRAQRGDTTLTLSQKDRCFLARCLPKLPGKQRVQRPVTIELNGHVGVRACEEDRVQVTELVLSESAYGGKPMRLTCNRDHLQRAAMLGLTEFRMASPNQPVVAQDERRLFLFISLPLSSASEAAAIATSVESSSVGSSAGRLVRGQSGASWNTPAVRSRGSDSEAGAELVPSQGGRP